MLNRWVVVFSGVSMNEQLRKYPDDQMNFMDAMDEVVGVRRLCHAPLY